MNQNNLLDSGYTRDDESLLARLSTAFGPSGYEDSVRDMIVHELESLPCELITDRVGNLFAVLDATAENDGTEVPTFLVSAHMDEVGFIIREVTDEGYLTFSVIGSIDPRVLCGRRVLIMTAKGPVHGMIASKAIHLQSAEERGLVTPVSKMYVDIGAADKATAEKSVSVGDFAVFETDFLRFADRGRLIKGKALDNRIGVYTLIETVKRLVSQGGRRNERTVFAFTVSGEVGVSGAACAVTRFDPDSAVIVNTVEVLDYEQSSCANKLGDGPVVTLSDADCLYDVGLTKRIRGVASKNGIPVQVRQPGFVRGGTDAAMVQKARCGIRVATIGCPARYTHSASTVADTADCRNMIEILYHLLADNTL